MARLTRDVKTGYRCHDCGRVVDGDETGDLRICDACRETRERRQGNQLKLFEPEV